jgi:2-methylcitrate dehydratase PrpD
MKKDYSMFINDPIYDLAKNAVEIGFDDLPKETISFQKKRFLDTIGTCIAGSNAQGVNDILNFFEGMGGKKESTVLIHGSKMPCQNAAFVNSVMCRAVDFCDAIPPGYHASSTDIPTVLAIGQMLKINGKEAITALAVGGDLAQRITAGGTWCTDQANHPYHGFDGNVVAPLAAATITGKLLKLGTEQMVDALGIAVNQAAGTYQSNIDGALVVRVIQGFATSAGINAALFAKMGISGVKNVLTGRFGFYELITRGKYDIGLIKDQLGKKFYGPEFSCIKAYPSCGLTLAVTDAALKLKSKREIAIDKISEVEVRVSEFAYNVTGKPFELDGNTEVSAQFNIQYVTANTLLRGNPKLEHFSEEYIKEKAIIELLEKIKVISDKKLVLDETDMIIKLMDGTEYSVHTQWGKGQPKNPLTEEEFEDKFYQCLKYSKLNLSEEHAKNIWDSIENLEEIKDVNDIIDLCVIN